MTVVRTTSPMQLFLVGPPGSGKTTLARKLLGVAENGELPVGSYLVPKPKWTITPDVAAVGHYTGSTFDGADTVPYNGVNAALDYWQENLRSKPLVIWDGDRFSHQAVLDRLDDAGAMRACVYIDVGDLVLAARRAQRGSQQNESWMKGRATKAQRFYDGFLFKDVEGAFGTHRLERGLPDDWLREVQEFLL